MTEWFAKFGVMKALMTDNWGEFNADEVREITSILNVQLCTTSGESPFQNGLCESVHAITDMMFFVCVEVLRPSQPIWVMSSAVNLPNHTFAGQA